MAEQELKIVLRGGILLKATEYKKVWRAMFDSFLKGLSTNDFNDHFPRKTSLNDISS